MLKLSVLDQSPIRPGTTAAEALRHTIELARETEKLGYVRFWVSEHHDTPGLAGSAPEVLIAAVAARTERMRIGSGGVLLSHYSPYKVAETFRVLEGLYPGRIDLGIGRAPGGMPIASVALRYGKPANSEQRFREALADLGGFLGEGFEEGHRFHGLLTTPMIDTAPQVWLLGSSGHSAVRAAEMGAPFAFAHFINGDGGQGVVRDYIASFKAGPFGARPQAAVCVTVVCADTDEEAERLAAPLDVGLLLLEKEGVRRPFPTEREALAYPLTDWDRERIRDNRKRMIVGGPDKVRRAMLAFSADYGVDEVIVTAMAGTFEERLHSYRLLAELFGRGG